MFDKKTASIASWFFVLCPYTIFYCLSGGITIYMTLGVSFFTYLILKSNIFSSPEKGLKIPLTMILLLLNVLYISSIRVTGAFFSIIVISSLAISLYLKSNILLNKLCIYLKLGYSHKIFLHLPKNCWAKIFGRRRTIKFYALNYILLRNLVLKIKSSSQWSV